MISTKIAYAGILERDFLTMTGISKRTLKNWNKKGAPKWADTIINLLRGNIKGCEGWNSQPGKIIDPEGNSYCLAEIKAIFFTRQMKYRIKRTINPRLASNDSLICYEHILNLNLTKIN